MRFPAAFLFFAMGLAVHILSAILMAQAMEDKGYGRGKVRVIGLALCALCGLGGCLFVAALPDIVLQDMGRRVLKELEKKG